MAADSPRSPRRALRLPRTAAAGSRPGGPYSTGGTSAASAAPSSSAVTAASRTRPPILLELSSSWVRAGFVGHIAAPQITLCHVPPPHPQAPASEWYRYYSPILQDATSYVLDGLASGATATSSSTSASAIEYGRRVLIIYHGMPYMGKNQLHALRRLLLDEYNLPAMSVQPAMKMAFYAAATTTATATAAARTAAVSTTTTTPLEHGMIVYVHGDEAHCVAVAHSRALDHTYQATGGTSTSASGSHEGPVTTLQQNWEQCWQKHFLNAESPHSLVLCMVRCVEACARDDRHRVVANLVFCGEWFLSDSAKVQQYIAQQLRKALSPPVDARSTSLVVPKPAGDEALTEASGKDPSPVRDIPTSSEPDPRLGFTHRAISSELRTQRLADSVGVAWTSNPSRSIPPCELLPWVGANVWAKHWYTVHPDAPAFQWETKQS